MIASPEHLEPSHLLEKTFRLLREALWTLFFFCAVYLALALFGYHRTDPTWTHATTQTTVDNPAGHFGAFLSDTLFNVFGHSAWWFVGLLIIVPIRGLRLLHEQDRRPLYICMLGFTLTLLASCTVEMLHFSDRSMNLPYAAGGVVGLLAARGLYTALGFVGSTLGLMVIFGIGLSLFIGFSWLSLSERLGRAMEGLALWATGRISERQDRLIGRTTTLQREAVVDQVLAKEQTPVHIETPKVAPKPSPQVEEERTKQIFPPAPQDAKPALDLLRPAKAATASIAPETVEFNSRQIELKLADFGIEAKTLSAYPGPVVTRYEIQPAVGVKGSQIMNLTKDLARSLSVSSVRIVETIPGKPCMGLELPNEKRQDVFLSEIIGSQTFYESKSPLPLGLGKDIAGHPVIADLTRMPHLLVAGTTGSGKSVGINAMILSILYKSTVDEARLILVDPKMLELSVYDGIGHLLTPVVTDMKEAAQALAWCVREMDRRYQLMSAMRVRNLAGFNQRFLEAQKKGEPLIDPVDQSPVTSMPYIVVVIDELADLMIVAGKQVEELIARLAQKARAAGIHLILATQRPSVDVITGLIKANIPTRISFQVASKVDSRTILDQMGAESLLGQGDMLMLEPGGQMPTRIHGAFVSDDEVHRVVSYLKKIGPPPVYENLKEPVSVDGADLGDIDGEDDPLYSQAVTVVRTSRRASISLVQRHLRIGYNRSARMIERMEKEGLVSSMSGNGNREVLAPAPSPDV